MAAISWPRGLTISRWLVAGVAAGLVGPSAAAVTVGTFATRRWYEVLASPHEATTAVGVGTEVRFAPPAFSGLSIGLRAGQDWLDPSDLVLLGSTTTYQIRTVSIDLGAEAGLSALGWPLRLRARLGAVAYGDYELHGTLAGGSRPVAEKAAIGGGDASLALAVVASEHAQLSLEGGWGEQSYRVTALEVAGQRLPLDPQLYVLRSKTLALGAAIFW